MEEEKKVSYLAFESVQARNERHIRRLSIALIICIFLIFASNAMLLYAWLQYDYSSEANTTTYEQDGKGINIIGDRNDVAKENSYR